MKKVNLFEELIDERNKEISSDELKTLLKNIWSKDDQIKKSLNEKNDEKFNVLKFDKMKTKNIFHRETIKKYVLGTDLDF